MTENYVLARLNTIAELNPPLGESLPDGESVSFLPMAAVHAESIDAVDLETRRFSEVRKGYTPFRREDVLVAKITPCFENGKIAQARITRPFGYGSTEFHVVRPRPDALDPRFLVHYLRQPRIRREGERKMTGSAGQRRVPEHFLAGLTVPLLPLPEQRRIASILDKADALRTKRRAALDHLDTLAQSIFLDMFGDPVANPKRWRTIKFGHACDRLTVGIVVKPASYYQPSGVPALRSLNVKPGRIVLDDVVYVSEKDNGTTLSKTRLKANDLVLVRSGQPGTAAVVPPELDGANAIDLLITTPSKDVCDPVFMCAFFNSPGGRAMVMSSERGQVQKHLNVGAIAQALVPIPPIQLQGEFSRRMAAREAHVHIQMTSLSYLNTLFASLQHRAFRGDL